MLFLLVALCLLGNEFDVPVFRGDHEIAVLPLDFSDVDQPKTLFSGLGQLESDGSKLYVADQKTPHVLVIDRKGRTLDAIGAPGNGPEGLGRGVFSFALEREHLWVSDWQRKALHHYKGTEHLARFEIPRTTIMSGEANPFAFSRKQGLVLFQAPFRSGHMASLYDFQGNFLRYVGPLPEFDFETRLAHPFIHSSLWVRGEQRWYALFKSMPTIIVFDNGFEEVDRFHLEGPEITYLQERFEHHRDNHPNQRGKRNFKTPPAHFTDFKYHDGQLFTLSHGTLYQIDASTGKVLSRSRFTTPEGPATFFYVTFLNKRTIVLGHPIMVRDHDLWIAEEVAFLNH